MNSQKIKCFYLDDLLSSEDEQFTLEALASMGAIDKSSVASLEYCRVPSVFPADFKGFGSSDSLQKAIQSVRKHLRNAGARQGDSQPVWIMPKDTARGGLFTMAFFEETGFYPYVVQRWRFEDGELKQGPARLINSHGMLDSQEKSID